MRKKQAATEEYKKRYHEAKGRKEKIALLDSFIALPCYKRKYATRLLNAPLRQRPKEAGLKARPANRKGKRVYDEEVIKSLRLIWEFFWNKCGKILAPFMRQEMDSIAEVAAFGITEEVRKKNYSR